jgi:hypothetical protein
MNQKGEKGRRGGGKMLVFKKVNRVDVLSVIVVGMVIQVLW